MGIRRVGTPRKWDRCAQPGLVGPGSGGPWTPGQRSCELRRAAVPRRRGRARARTRRGWAAGAATRAAEPFTSTAARTAYAACLSQVAAVASTVAKLFFVWGMRPRAFHAGVLLRGISDCQFRARGFGASFTLSSAQKDFLSRSR